MSHARKTTTLILTLTLVLAGCGARGSDPATGRALDGIEPVLPALNAVERVTFTHPYSCYSGGGAPSYDGSALFLSDYARQRNAPDLLYDGACGSTAYLQAATAGDDFALIADLGEVPLAQVTPAMAFNLTQVVGGDNTFTRTAPVVVGHTYAVLISKSDIRALFVLRVEAQVADGPMTISYAVKAYAIQETLASAPGFGWGAPSSAPVPPAKTGAAVQGQLRLAANLACGDAPSNDCRGLVYVGVIDRPAPLPESTLLGSTLIPAADLSGGRTLSYAVTGLPAGSYYVAAMLVETGTPGDPPYPKPGDLTAAPSPILLQAGATTSHDLTLSARF
jgi:hypothetical protein